MFYCTALLLLAATADVFGYTLVGNSPQVGVLGGDRVPITAVPYMADLRRDGKNHWCAATIVHEQFALTAAHCIEPNEKYVIAVGSEDIRGGEIYEVEKALLHEKSKTDADYDICLLKLAKKITFGPKVQNIYLASEPFNLIPGNVLNVTGWGRTAEEGKWSRALLQVSVPFITQSECKEIYTSISSEFSGYITDNVICAGGMELGRGPCEGDGGSPLVYNDVQLGITAFGGECGNLPGIYIKLSAFEQWIAETVAKNS